MNFSLIGKQVLSEEAGSLRQLCERFDCEAFSRVAELIFKHKGKIVFSGTIKSMRHGPVDITEAKLDSECGVCINRYDDVKKGDILEFMQRK